MSTTGLIERLLARVQELESEVRTLRGRVQHLDRLRELVGEEALRTGVMPPPVPWWRFQEIDP